MVAYASSEEEDGEEEEESDAEEATAAEDLEDEDEEEDEDEGEGGGPEPGRRAGLFSSLPPPQRTFAGPPPVSLDEPGLAAKPRKRTQPVRIAAPQLQPGDVSPTDRPSGGKATSSPAGCLASEGAEDRASLEVGSWRGSWPCSLAREPRGDCQPTVKGSIGVGAQ